MTLSCGCGAGQRITYTMAKTGWHFAEPESRFLKSTPVDCDAFKVGFLPIASEPDVPKTRVLPNRKQAATSRGRVTGSARHRANKPCALQPNAAHFSTAKSV